MIIRFSHFYLHRTSSGFASGSITASNAVRLSWRLRLIGAMLAALLGLPSAIWWLGEISREEEAANDRIRVEVPVTLLLPGRSLTIRLEPIAPMEQAAPAPQCPSPVQDRPTPPPGVSQGGPESTQLLPQTRQNRRPAPETAQTTAPQAGQKPPRGEGLTARAARRKFSAAPQVAQTAQKTGAQMSEQTANGRNSHLTEVIVGVVPTAMFALLTVMFTMLSNSDQQLANRMSELERKVEALDRKVDENRIILTEMQTTLKVIASGLNIRVEPKEQAGPADALTPNEKLATKDP